MRSCRIILAGATMLSCFTPLKADEAAALRLVPFPKQVELRDGKFPLNGSLTLEVPAAMSNVLGRLIGEELRRAGLPAPKIREIQSNEHSFRLSAKPGRPAAGAAFRDGAASDDYLLDVTGEGVVCTALGEAGLLHGAQTLRQLIRANRRGDALPRLSIRDWPSLQWRCFQDDMTRGPSARLETLNRQIDLGAELKMNLFTYYMEYQFAFQKHPKIGPKASPTRSIGR